ncbi:hypothetical protein JW968_04835 [Candidatus Woesearchaeota archaeon]|nr:hypothetical protein [Candidatus Woesearchaeota archaeon]
MKMKNILIWLMVLLVAPLVLAEITGTLGGGGGSLSGTVDGLTGTMTCGNGVCDSGESYSNCPADCRRPSGGSPIIMKGGGGVADKGGFDCEPNWTCSDYGPCGSDDLQRRTCTDVNKCETGMNMPALTKSCIFRPAEEKPAQKAPEIPTGAAIIVPESLNFIDNIWALIILIIVLFILVFSLIEMLVSAKRRKDLRDELRKVSAQESEILTAVADQKKMLQGIRDEIHYLEDFNVHFAHEDFSKLFLYIKHALERGRSKEQIAESLVSAGWARHIVDVVFAEASKVRDLQLYIRKARNAGIPDDKIREVLLNVGWRRSIVDAYLR